MRVAELLYSARDDWSAVCRCMIADSFRHQEIWSWLEKLPTSAFQTVILAHVGPLVTIDASRFATLIVTKIPSKLPKILEKLSANENLEYSLLSGLYNITQYKEEEDSKLELSIEQLEKYLDLMCRHESDKVVSHINSNHGCRLDQALKIVRDNCHRDAEALMLEKLGNFQEAFDLLLRDLCERLEKVRNLRLTNIY